MFMARFLHRNLSPGFRKYSTAFLALSWCLGLLLGVILYPAAGPSFASLMRMAAIGRVSIVGLVSSFLLPFLFSAFAVYLSLPQLLTVVCFCKALLLAFVSCGAADAFGSAGWLVRFFLMFGDILSCVLLYWYARRHISGRRSFSLAEFCGCIGALILLGGLDQCYIAPFLTKIISL